MATKAPQKVSAVLKRMTLTIPKEGNDSAVIAEKAARLLGYNGAMSSHGVAGDLGKILIELDIRPYEIKRVAAYKEKKRKEAHAERRAHAAAYTEVRSGWKLVPLSKYAGVIPEFVLRKAVQIKEAAPTALFYVDVLKVNTKRIPDPFLVIKQGSEKYWVEVWDEAEFEAGLIDN